MSPGWIRLHQKGRLASEAVEPNMMYGWHVVDEMSAQMPGRRMGITTAPTMAADVSWCWFLQSLHCRRSLGWALIPSSVDHAM